MLFPDMETRLVSPRDEFCAETMVTDEVNIENIATEKNNTKRYVRTIFLFTKEEVILSF